VHSPSFFLSNFIMPTTQELAQASQAAYSLSKSGSRSERLAHAQSHAPSNYSIVPEYTDKHITTMKHDTNHDHIISHRGTDLSGSQRKADLVSDMSILAGHTEHDKLHKKRTARTEHIVKQIRKNGDSDIHLTGHSLGGSTAQHSMLHSKFVRENVASNNTFNAGASPNPFKTKKGDHKKNSRAHNIIEEKSTHHHIRGDGISSGVKKQFIGKHKSYKSSKKPSLLNRLVKKVKPLLSTSPLLHLASMTAKKVDDTLNSHSITHFI